MNRSGLYVHRNVHQEFIKLNDTILLENTSRATVPVKNIGVHVNDDVTLFPCETNMYTLYFLLMLNWSHLPDLSRHMGRI